MVCIVYDPADRCIWGAGPDHSNAMLDALANIRRWEKENLDQTQYAVSGNDNFLEYFLLPRKSRVPDRLVVCSATISLVEQVREEGCVKAFSIENGLADKIKSA